MSDDTWISDYVLGEGSEAQRAEVERRLAADPLLAERARELQQVVGLLGELPGEAWPDLNGPLTTDGITETAPPSVAPGPSAPDRRRRRSLVTAMVALALFAAGLGVGAAVWSGSGSGAAGGRATAQVALKALGATAGSRARGRATLTADGRLQLSVSGLPDTGRGHFYEAWLMTSTSRLVPLGSFRTTGGAAEIRVVPPTALTAYRYVDVSLQSTADGPTISSQSVLRGATGGR